MSNTPEQKDSASLSMEELQGFLQELEGDENPRFIGWVVGSLKHWPKMSLEEFVRTFHQDKQRRDAREAKQAAEKAAALSAADEEL